jgi:hypothetical protein
VSAQPEIGSLVIEAVPIDVIHFQIIRRGKDRSVHHNSDDLAKTIDIPVSVLCSRMFSCLHGPFVLIKPVEIGIVNYRAKTLRKMNQFHP